MPLDHQVTNVRELQRLMRRLPERMEKKVLSSATSAATTVIRKEIQARARVKRGVLKREIRQKKLRQAEAPPGGVAFRVGPSRRAFHALFLEKGTSKMPAKPFIRPAYEAVKDKAVAKWVERGAKAFIREANKLAGPLKQTGLLKRRRRVFR